MMEPLWSFHAISFRDGPEPSCIRWHSKRLHQKQCQQFGPAYRLLYNPSRARDSSKSSYSKRDNWSTESVWHRLHPIRADKLHEPHSMWPKWQVPDRRELLHTYSTVDKVALPSHLAGNNSSRQNSPVSTCNWTIPNQDRHDSKPCVACRFEPDRNKAWFPWHNTAHGTVPGRERYRIYQSCDWHLQKPHHICPFVARARTKVCRKSSRGPSWLFCTAVVVVFSRGMWYEINNNIRVCLKINELKCHVK